MERKNMFQRFSDWINERFGFQPEALNSGDEPFGLERIMKNERKGYEEYLETMKPKTEIEYWKNEIDKYTQFIQNEQLRLSKAMVKNSMTPDKYNWLTGGIERAIQNIEFAQKSIETLLLVQTLDANQVSRVKTSTTNSLQDQKQRREDKIKAYKQLGYEVDIYQSREKIVDLTKQIDLAKNDEEREKIYSQLKDVFAKLKSTFKTIGIDRDFALDDQYYQIFSRNSNFRKNFLTKTIAENKELLSELEEECSDILKIKGNHSVAFVRKTIDRRISKNEQELNDISQRLDFISNSSVRDIIALTTLGMYGRLYGESNELASRIDASRDRKYNLSDELLQQIDQNSANIKSTFLNSIKNKFSSQVKQQKMELVFAMYPFLRIHENKETLAQYLKQNDTFLNRLVASGITPEQIITENRRLSHLRQEKIASTLDNNSKIEELENNRYLQYHFAKKDMKLTLLGKQIEYIKNLPLANEGEKNKSYIKRITENMISAMHGKSQQTISTEEQQNSAQQINNTTLGYVSQMTQRLSDATKIKFNIANIKELYNKTKDYIKNKYDNRNMSPVYPDVEGTADIPIDRETSRKVRTIYYNPINLSDMADNRKSVSHNQSTQFYNNPINLSEMAANREEYNVSSNQGTQPYNNPINLSEMANKKYSTQASLNLSAFDNNDENDEREANK